MGLTYNSQNITELYYNAQQVGQVKFNDSVIWKYAPAVPAFTVSNYGHSSTSVRFHWTNGMVKDSLRYRIAYGEDEHTANEVTVNNSTEGVYDLTGLTPNTIYYFKVRAEGTWDDSEYSAITSRKTAPAAPSAFSASTYDFDSIYLTWNASAGAERYYIDRKVGEGAWTTWNFTTSTSIYNDGLSHSTTYQYRIRSFAAETSFGSYADPVTVSTGDVLTNGTILTLVNKTQSSVSLSWLAVNDATGYLLERKTGSGGVWAEIQDLKSTSFNDTGLSDSQEYVYRVSAYIKYEGDDSVSEYSDELNVTTKTILAAPQNISSPHKTDNTIFLDWDDVPNASSYLVEISTSASFDTVLRATTVQSSQSGSAALTQNTRYYFRIKAKGTGEYVDSPHTFFDEQTNSS